MSHQGTEGERLGFQDDAEQWEMHTYRYEVASRFVRDTDTVVDAACGIGYGEAILGAGRWVGVDIHEEPGILVADLRTWVPNFEFDVFVGIESIEHITPLLHYVAAAKMAKRTIVISTPIIPTTHFNPYHVHDFTKESLEDLFWDWRVVHYEAQADPILGPDIYGIWAFER